MACWRRRGAGRRRRLVHCRPRRSVRPGGRERQRQVDAGPHADAASQAHRRYGILLWNRPRARFGAGPPSGTARHADDLSGHQVLAQSAAAGAEHHRRAADHPRPRSRPRCDPRPPAPGRSRRAPHRPLSPPALGRSATARRHCPRARPKTEIHHRRRAGLGPRRLDSGADPQPDEAAATRAQHYLLSDRP